VENDSIRRQESLRVSFVKLREELALLVRNFINDEWIKNLTKLFLTGATAVIQFADSIRSILPLISALAGAKLFKIAPHFGSGLKSELLGRNKGGTVPGIGS